MAEADIYLDCFNPEAPCENCGGPVGTGPAAGHTDDDVLMCDPCWLAIFPKAHRARTAAQPATPGDGLLEQAVAYRDKWSLDGADNRPIPVIMADFARTVRADAQREMAEVCTILKKALDRDWSDETPVVIATLASNGIYWREKAHALARRGTKAAEQGRADDRRKVEEWRSEVRQTLAAINNHGIRSERYYTEQEYLNALLEHGPEWGDK